MTKHAQLCTSVHFWHYCVRKCTKCTLCTRVDKSAQCSFIFPPCAGLVGGPYHGARIDVEQAAATSRLVMVITNPSRVMRTLQLSPCMRDCTVLTEGHQCQAAENIFDRDDIHDRLGFWLIEELCSRISGLPVWLSPAKREVVHIRTLYCKKIVQNFANNILQCSWLFNLCTWMHCCAPKCPSVHTKRNGIFFEFFFHIAFFLAPWCTWVHYSAHFVSEHCCALRALLSTKVHVLYQIALWPIKSAQKLF